MIDSFNCMHSKLRVEYNIHNNDAVGTGGDKMNMLPFLYEGYGEWWTQSQFNERQYPPADPAVFMKSADVVPILLQDAQKIAGKVASSQVFSKNLMEAAQKNEKQKAIAEIQTIGLTSLIDIAYTPDILTIRLFEKDGCCQLNLQIRWR